MACLLLLKHGTSSVVVERQNDLFDLISVLGLEERPPSAPRRLHQDVTLAQREGKAYVVRHQSVQSAAIRKNKHLCLFETIRRDEFQPD